MNQALSSKSSSGKKYIWKLRIWKLIPFKKLSMCRHDSQWLHSFSLPPRKMEGSGDTLYSPRATEGCWLGEASRKKYYGCLLHVSMIEEQTRDEQTKRYSQFQVERRPVMFESERLSSMKFHHTPPPPHPPHASLTS